MRIAGSLAIHALLLALLWALDTAESAHPLVRPVAVNIETIASSIELAPQPSTVSGGGSPSTTPASRPSQPRAKPLARRTSTPITARSLVGDIRMEPGDRDREVMGRTDDIDDDRNDDGTGNGNGNGNGIGNGIGSGIGNGLGDGFGQIAPPTIAPPREVPALVERPPSKARPPRLVYPKKQRDVDDGELFVARVTVDREGFVVGAKLVRGSGHRAEVASSLIFRFRYEPALDDDGKAIAATIEQPFGVE